MAKIEAMPSATAIRRQIEAALAHRIPAALTPVPRAIRPVSPTGVAEVDALLDGGFPIGAITELTGPECSGRTSLALSFLARATRTAHVAAWVDVSNTLDPESAAAAGVELDHLLWVRCGAIAAETAKRPGYRFALPEKYLVPPEGIPGLHGGGCGGHPRGEVKGLAAVVGNLLQGNVEPRCAEPQHKRRVYKQTFAQPPLAQQPDVRPARRESKPWKRMEQALRVTDLLLQAGGFSAIVLDLGSIAPEYASRVPLATWFRYRAAAERGQSSIILLSQHACAKSSAELLLRFRQGMARDDERTVFTGMEYHVEVEHRRFTQTASNVIPLRKPPQRETSAVWRSQSAWAGMR